MTGSEPAHGNLTPPRISPSCPHCVILQPDGFQMLWTTLILSRAVAGQEYHCLRTRSLRGSLPKLLLDGWVPLVTLLGRLYAGTFLPHRWSSRILRIAVPFLAHPLDVIQSLDMYFSSCTRWTENVPSMHRPRERLFYKVV